MRMFAKHPSLEPGRSDPRLGLPQLPDHHTYTVGQAIMNRSCLAHYPEGMSTQNQDGLRRSLEVLRGVHGPAAGLHAGPVEVQQLRPGTPTRRSTRLLEGKSADQIALDELTLPFGLQDAADREPRRFPAGPGHALQQRATASTPATTLSNKWYGGGFVSSAPRPHPLRRRGPRRHDPHRRPARGDVDADRRLCVRLGRDSADSGGALRPPVRRPARRQVVPSIFPDDDIVISVLSNRWEEAATAPASWPRPSAS